VLPELDEPGHWTERVNTAQPGERAVRGGAVNLAALSLILLTHGLQP